MKKHKVGIIMNGVTGRMGTNQHLIRSIVAIRKQGGVQIKPGEVIIEIDPVDSMLSVVQAERNMQAELAQIGCTFKAITKIELQRRIRTMEQRKVLELQHIHGIQ